MPSKSKKQSKKPSGVSTPHTPAPPTPSVDSEISDESLVERLEEASKLYPYLIGKTAFVGRVAGVKHCPRGNTIWLSDSPAVSSSFAHDSLVSVSSPSNSKLAHSIPLSSLSDEFAKHFGVHFLDRFTDEAGNYFALAKLCFTSEVSKNEVRLSSNLANTMGDPTLGRAIFVYPVQTQMPPTLPTKDENMLGTKAVPLSVFDCSELYLELVHSRKLTASYTSSRISSETPYGSRNGAAGSASPRTPMNQIKASSSLKNQLTSPIGEDTADKLADSNGVSIDSSDITKLLGDDDSARRLLGWATPWLLSCCLLRGNLVTIPVLYQLCTFRVVGAKRLWKEEAKYCLTNGSGKNMLPEVSEPPEHLIDASSENLIDAFIVQRQTKVCLTVPSKLISASPEKQVLSGVCFDLMDDKADSGDNNLKLGGLSKEYEILKDIIVSSSMNTLSSLGLRSTKGVLLHGPPGTGKTSLARLCVRDSGANIFSVNGPELVSQFYGESERALHEVFESAHQAAPAVVFIDELDAIAPARKDGGEELSQRMVATLLNLMDGVGRTEGILVIAATNRPDSIEPALRRPGRLDREIEIGVPSPKQRLDILRSLLDDMEHSLSDNQIENLSIATHGFVGADLAALCNEAALVCLRNYVNSRNSHATSVPYKDSDIVDESDCLKDRGDNLRDYLDSASSSISNGMIFDDNVNGVQNGIAEESMLKVDFECFEKAKMKVRPSAMREVILEVPKVRWEDVGGQREVKRQLMEAVEWPQKHQDAFKRIGTRPPTGVLMFGPPGCSKTLMARAVASEAGLNFLAVKGPELFSKWVGESEKAVRSLFAKARANAPSIIFFDEIDGLASVRGKENDGVSVSDRVMSQLLVEMDGLHQRLNVTVIAATNRPDKIDSALLRPGRFDRLLYVGPPNESDREEIFRIHLRKIPCSSDVSIKDLSSLTEGFSGADISSVCREAALKAMEEDLHASEITMQHLKTSIEKVQPSTAHSYQELSEKFQRLVHSSGEEKISASNAQVSRTGFPCGVS